MTRRRSILTTIDPTFLEALPEYLRAEVLASHENQINRAPSIAPPAPLPTEDIDPEFLAALPPDIQAEVLAQQRAQRLVQSQQVEGQPVDMDSASIIATFPAELREEVSFCFDFFMDCDLRNNRLTFDICVSRFF